MSKKIQIPTRPPKQPSADDWIADKETPKEKSTVKPVRMTVELDPDIHRELKIHCTMKGIWISELMRDLISKELTCSKNVQTKESLFTQ